MKALQEPFRYDYVGSFLRPEKVKNAKALYEDSVALFISFVKYI